MSLWGSFASISADFIGALRAALLSLKRPVGNRPAGCNPAPQCSISRNQRLEWTRGYGRPGGRPRARTPHHLSRVFQKVGTLFSRWVLCPHAHGIYRFLANRASRRRLSMPPPTCRHLGQRSGRIPALPYPLPKRFPVYPILASPLPFALVACPFPRRSGSYNVPVLSIAISTASQRSMTPRVARP